MQPGDGREPAEGGDRRRQRAARLRVVLERGEAAVEVQRERGRGVSRYAFLRHRRAAARLLRAVDGGELPRGCGSAVLLDRDAAGTLRRIGFTG